MKLSLMRACLVSFCVVAASPGLAQLVSPPQSLANEADPAAQLSENLKALARDPYNVDALLLAGQGALAIGDANAAFGFFARAEELSPQNWRAKSGLGSSLTMLEKSREALRVFDEAIALGAPEQDVVADRGLAHDLEGDGKKAQRDYLTALRLRPTDEVTRRLALSLGIAGDKEAALARLDPLVRKNDQGAWRARAFILAMNGDTSGAERIVRMVAPADTAASMLGFMQRLTGLGAAAKAHAVHFGTLPATSGNSPVLLTEDSFQPLEAGAAVKLAVAETDRRPSSAPADMSSSGDARRGARPSRDPQLAALAARGRSASGMAPSGMAAPLSSSDQPSVSTAGIAPATSASPPMPMAQAPAARFEVPSPPPRATASSPVNRAPAPSPAVQTAVPSVPPPTSAPSVVRTAPAPVAAPPVSSAATAPAVTMAAPSASSAPVVQSATLPASTASQMQLPTGTTGTVFSSAAQQSSAPVPTLPPAAAPITQAAPVAETVPSQIAQVADPVPQIPENTAASSSPVDQDVPVQLAEAPTAQAQPSLPMAALPPAPAPRLTLGEIVNTLQLEPESAPVALPDAAKLKALRLAAQKKAAAEEKARAEKAAQERKAAEEAAKARRNPARLWVQIATGRNTAGLPGTWRNLKSQAPKALGDQKPWSVPYLQTNRLLVGPMRSSKAARDLVKDLASEGVKAMVFNSEAGQEIERVDN
ncbi:MAG: SPOR domain-containing protein [Chakrabartia sp.]